jgi:hypothetical protein
MDQSNAAKRFVRLLSTALFRGGGELHFRPSIGGKRWCRSHLGWFSAPASR